MNSGKSKTPDFHRLFCNLSDKIVLQRSDKYVALSNFSAIKSYLSLYTWENIKLSHKNNKFKISAPTWNDKFELFDESYSVSD